MSTVDRSTRVHHSAAESPIGALSDGMIVAVGGFGLSGFGLSGFGLSGFALSGFGLSGFRQT